MLSENSSKAVRLRNLTRLRKALRHTLEYGKRVATSWFVVTGAPGSGKTTVIAELRRRGYNVVEDPARRFFETQIRKGRTKHDARANYMAVQHKILEEMLVTAKDVSPLSLTFFDYSLPDNLAFLEVRNIEWPTEFLDGACLYAYRHTFLLSMFDKRGFDAASDPVRTESLRQRTHIESALWEIYGELRIPITRVVGTVKERVDSIVRLASASTRRVIREA